MVVKFLRQRPSLDSIRAFIRSRWGLSSLPVVSAMQRPRNIFIRMSNELDFLKALSRKSCDIEGVPYRPFAWSPEFDEDVKPPSVPIWVFLPGLPPNFYHASLLKMLTAPIGKYIRRDNPTKCATRTDGARICLEINAAQKPITHFWIGIPRMPKSRRQEIIYETLPAYCSKCRCQGHNQRTCRYGSDKNQIVKGGKTWKKVTEKPSTKEGNVDGVLSLEAAVTNSETMDKSLVPFVGVVIAEQGETSKQAPQDQMQGSEQLQGGSEKEVLREVVPVGTSTPGCKLTSGLRMNVHESMQNNLNGESVGLEFAINALGHSEARFNSEVEGEDDLAHDGSAREPERGLERD
ncbi:uncharacterized protein LOC122310071 [Carya illinoinensis]|uniref:uncharacterized protein LOC122310071 n=1 Tax=Carya illinoinensis TaxID=32201 RepID=UPI001C723B61|nr:uncharacterized protein LOC122310071 [Carya illinoinensis]